MPRRPTLTCADCAKPMWVGAGVLPQGQARCRDCRRANPQPRRQAPPQTPPPYKAMECAECGRSIWKGSSSRPEGEAKCLDCYRGGQERHERRDPCIDCGTQSWGERCLPCRAKFQIVRADDDYRVVRRQREHAAPGLSSYRRSLLLAAWKRGAKSCAYCPAPADTIDHVVPLVRGGTNYEGNLVPACRRCNCSKSARTVMEWRAGRQSPRMAAPLPWKREPKALRIDEIRGEQIELFRVCVCGTAYAGRAAYCSHRCHARSAYRLKVGIPLDAAPYEAVRVSA